MTSLADNTGTVQEYYTYDPYGKVSFYNSSLTQISASAFGMVYLFQGGRYDTVTGLYNFRNRDLSPTLGRWMEEDHSGYSGGGNNLYIYESSLPEESHDPLGLWRWPDSLSLNINIAIPNPFTLTFVGVTLSVNLDNNGNLYFGIGGNLGKSLTVVSASLTANWVNKPGKPPAQQLKNLLTQNSFNATVGYWGGVQETYTPGAGWATGVGICTPQAGVGYTYSWLVTNF